MGRRTYVELFAGCGGMSLGLASLGYERLMANELSPMAAESYAFNLLGTDMASEEFRLSELSDRRVLWIDSAHPIDGMTKRLGENPAEEEGRGYSDIRELGVRDLTGKLIVGDIRKLNDWVDQLGVPIVQQPDIISGGPPCQSFSMAGLRNYGNVRNRLPWEFARFVKLHQPKIAILENVSGILHPFRSGDDKVYAWFEVAKAFAKIGYAPICLHVNAVNVGVAQNRPRFLMFAVRQDLVGQVRRHLGEAAPILDFGRNLLDERGDTEFDPAAHRVIDVRNAATTLAPRLLRELFCPDAPATSVADAINDLSVSRTPKSPYVQKLSDLFDGCLTQPPLPGGEPFNHSHRHHGGRVKARFRIYQLIAQSEVTPQSVQEVKSCLRGDPDAPGGQLYLTPRTTDCLWQTSVSASLPVIDEWGVPLRMPSELPALVSRLRTRKFSQRALRSHLPAPAALSIPDDACHYQELRTLSVREMARIQSFPDRFVFRSVPTTGGSRRKYQVPQYTQVGNAVPPKLGRVIGQFADCLLGSASAVTTGVTA